MADKGKTMTDKLTTLPIDRVTSLRCWGGCCVLASDLYGTEDRCDGSRAERFIAGWTNAADMIEVDELDERDWEAVKTVVLSEVLNHEPALFAKATEMVECDCGHECGAAMVMSASTGTACPDCYDMMSN